MAAAVSCAPLRTTSPVEHTMSAFVVYTPADIVPGASLQGEAVDVIAVRGGEIVRLAVRQARDLETGELASTAAGRSAESWSRVAPNAGLVWLRPMAFTNALLVPRGSLIRADIGHSSDPGYPPSPARWVAHARIAIDRKLPGTVEVSGVGWVVVTNRAEHCVVIEAGKRLAIEAPAGAVYRIEARASGARPADLRLEVGGRERVVPSDGSPLILGFPERTRIVLRAMRGTLTVVLAERVALEPAASTGEQSAAGGARADEMLPARSLVNPAALDPDGALHAKHPAWLATAEASPSPLTAFESDLGTAVAEAGVIYGTLREGSAPSTDPDGFAFGILGYRRRIESIGSWTAIEGFARARPGEPSYGGSAALYEEIESLHLRLSSTFGIAAQHIDAELASRWFLRGFAEYSWRATSDFFLLPRLGYDTAHTSLDRRPADLDEVDDEVYNAYRAPRPTFLYAQALLWFTPRFNEITYLRLRAAYDPAGGHLSHVSVRPGAFIAFGALDLAAYLDGAWYSPDDSASGRARFSPNLGFVTHYNFWSGFGSLGVQPGLAAFSNIATGGFQVSVFVNLVASIRRGVRDFSSLELDFPEQLGGGIPWRGTNPGGYR